MADNRIDGGSGMEKERQDTVFAMGGPNEAYAKYFIGDSYLRMLTTEGVVIGNVTFAPGCRNYWHIHKAEKGGGQILLCTNGKGWFQEWGKEARASGRRRGRCPSGRKALAWSRRGQLVHAFVG